jgi:translation initiation factor 3 subunit G
MTSRFGNWADAAEDSDEETSQPMGGMFETKADEHGIKTVIEYKEKDGKTYKVTKRVKETKIVHWTNQHITDRLNMKKFGKALSNDLATEKHLVIRSEEEVHIELSRKIAATVIVKDEAEEKFYVESFNLNDSMQQVKKSWTDANRAKQLDRDDAGAERPAEPDKPSELRESAAAAVAKAAAGPGGPAAYVPPSLRGKAGATDPKGKGKGGVDQSQEASLRITNLSEDAKEGDLQDLFSSVGRLQRVYLAKDQETGLSRGFAFVTYYTREDAQKAIDKLNGYGYDNLILQVQFAKPRV